MIEINYENIQSANETIKTTDIKGKDYAEVNQRIKAFRMVYPTGTIETEMVSNEKGICVFRAKVGYTRTVIDIEKGILSDVYTLLGTGTAYEKENSTFALFISIFLKSSKRPSDIRLLIRGSITPVSVEKKASTAS